MDDDGLPIRESGDWIRRKHHFLDRYCDIFTRSMKGKWHRIYLDVMAGPGRCRIRETGELSPGSPLVALNHDFDEFRFFEGDSIGSAALAQRVGAHSKANICTVSNTDWTKEVLSPAFRLPPHSLTLAFVDPTGIAQVPWKAVRALANSSRTIDIMFTIQHALGINWNAHQYLASKSDETAADAFVGGRDWRDRLRPTTSVREALIAQFVENMGGLGFQTREWRLVGGLYYLCLFSRSPLALKFWSETVLKDEAGQKAFRFEG